MRGNSLSLILKPVAEGMSVDAPEPAAFETSEDVLYFACQALRPYIDFDVTGFGCDSWPVTVETDLLVIVEQLPDTLQALRATADFDLDFYEQGIERRIFFERQGDDYRIRCFDAYEMAYVYDKMISRDDLAALLEPFFDAFVSMCRRYVPELAAEPMFAEWVRGAKAGV